MYPGNQIVSGATAIGYTTPDLREVAGTGTPHYPLLVREGCVLNTPGGDAAFSTDRSGTTFSALPVSVASSYKPENTWGVIKPKLAGQRWAGSN